MALNERTETLLLGALGDEVAKTDMVNAINANNLPDQSGQTGKFLSTDGTEVSWQTAGGSGVTSLNTLTGSVVLAAGTNITLTPSGNTVTIDATGSGGANTSLSNLASTSINADLIFDENDHFILAGSSHLLFIGHQTSSGATGNTIIAGGNTSGANTGGDLQLSSGNSDGGNSGNVNISIGNAGGTKGKINLSGESNVDGNLILSQIMSLQAFGETGTVVGYGIDPTVNPSSFAYLIGQNDIPSGNTTTPTRNLMVTTASRNDSADPNQTDNMYVTVGETYGTGGTGSLYLAGGKSYGVGGNVGAVYLLGNINDPTASPIYVQGKLITLGDSSVGTAGTVTIANPQVVYPTGQTLTAGGTISSNKSFNELQAASPISTDTTTVIAAGLATGQTLQLLNIGSNTITLKSGGNTKLPGQTDLLLAANSSASFIFYSGVWYCTGSSIN